jgi:hypothetical protein
MRVTVEDKHHNVKQLYRTAGGFTTHRLLALKTTIGDDKIGDAKKWAKKRGWDIRITKSDYPFIILDDDTKMVQPKLAKKIDKMGRRRKRYIWMGEGWRTRARQEELWREYVNRGYSPPTVARPGTSNHETGWAADISVFLRGLDHEYTNVGYDDQCRRIMHGLNLCLCVPGEMWHAQIGDDWRN